PAVGYGAGLSWSVQGYRWVPPVGQRGGGGTARISNASPGLSSKVAVTGASVRMRCAARRVVAAIPTMSQVREPSRTPRRSPVRASRPRRRVMSDPADLDDGAAFAAAAASEEVGDHEEDEDADDAAGEAGAFGGV